MVRHLSPASLSRLCHLDPDREAALVALYRDADGRQHIIGVSRYHLDTSTGEAEFAVVVTDAWQGKGIGWLLMRRLADVAGERGVKRLAGEVLRENTGMLELMSGLGFTIQPTDDPTIVRTVKDITLPVNLTTLQARL